MPGLYSRVKSWIKSENVKAADVNAEFNNVITKSEAQYLGGDSANVTGFRLEEATGDVGTESLPTSIAGELRRLRYVIRRLLGSTYWYSAPNTSLASLKATLDASNIASVNIIESGKLDANNQPNFLEIVTATSLRLQTSTPFRVYIKGDLVEVSSNLTLSGLSGPSSYTQLVDDTDLAGGEETRTTGEGDTVLTIDTPTGTPPSNETYQAFKIVSGANTEYFYARFLSNTKIDKALRGFFFDSSNVAIPRIAISNNDTLTLCRAAYIFLTNLAGVKALAVTYNKPAVQKDEPSGPSANDWWLDTSANVWKRYSGSAWADGDGLFIGMALMDGSTCVGVRSFDINKAFSSLNTIKPIRTAVSIVEGNRLDSKISVYGNTFGFVKSRPVWNLAVDMTSGETETVSRTHYFYVTDLGDVNVSLIAPYDRRGDLQGFYHPHKPWRCVARVFNDSSSDLLSYIDQFDVFGENKNIISMTVSAGLTTTSATPTISNLKLKVPCSGDAVEIKLVPANTTTGILKGIASNAETVGVDIYLYRNGVALFKTQLIVVIKSGDATTDPEIHIPVSAVSFFDPNPPPGENLYAIYLDSVTAGDSANILNARMIAIRHAAGRVFHNV